MDSLPRRRLRALTRARLGVFAALACAALCSMSPSFADAQHTGSSFGGGDFGGGSHSDHGSGSSDSYGTGGGGDSQGGSGVSHGDSSTRSRRGGSSGSNSHLWSGWSWLCVLGALFLWGSGYVLITFVVPTVTTNREMRELARDPHVPGTLGSSGRLVDVSAIQLALDWRARPALQKRLESLARAGQTSTPGGLAHLLHETVTALRRAEVSWLYAGAVNTLPIQPDQAERLFRSIALEARSRFAVETIRAVDGRVASADAPAMRARSVEGAGLVVVTLVVAASRAIPDVAKAADARELGRLMRDLGALTARDIIALEVIWTPSAEDDRMSSAELEALYPQLRRMDANTLVGRVFCGYCAQPFPAELQHCPSCGAPSAEPPRAPA